MRRALAGLCLAATALAAGGPASAQTPPAAGPNLEAAGRLPEPAPSIPSLAYDARLLSSAAAAERFQGALDGGWVLSAAGQGDLYAFQLVDRRQGLEGAWRDLRRPGQPAASGFLELQRTPQALVLRFTPAPEAPATVTLRPDLSGELDQGGRRTPVVLRRDRF